MPLIVPVQESKVGLAVGKLRSNSSPAVAELAKEIVKKWKTDVEKEKQRGGKSPGTANATKTQRAWISIRFQIIVNFIYLVPCIIAVSRKLSTASVTPTTPTTPSMSASSSKTDLRTAKSDGAKIELVDVTRKKCAELIYDALASDSGSRTFILFLILHPNVNHLTNVAHTAIEQILAKAKGIESTIYAENNGTTAAYKSKIRSLYVNLKDKNNPTLRESVVSGELSVQRLCKMSSQVRVEIERRHIRDKRTQSFVPRKWPLRSVKRRTRRLLMRIYSNHLELKKSKQKLMPSSADGANRYALVVLPHGCLLFITLN